MSLLTDRSVTAQNLVLESERAGRRIEGVFTSMSAPTAHGRKALMTRAGKTGRFTVESPIPRTGYYRVYAWWPSGLRAPASASYTVLHRDGAARLERNQAVRGGQWSPLGDFPFDQGLTASIVVENLSGSRIAVDAFRLAYLGTDAPRLTVEDRKLPVLVAGEFFSYELTAVGGSTPRRWLARNTLPAGLALTESGTLSGTPQEMGTFHLEVQVEDLSGGIAEDRIRLDIVAPPDVRSLDAPVGDPDAAVEGGGFAELLQIVDDLWEGNWARVNLNSFSEAWTPEERRPLQKASNPTPSAIIRAWSSFAWDSRRWDLILYGGGHANYPGNDVYRWRASTRRWERASLPSEIIQDIHLNWIAVDGADNAPASAHTYDNAIYLELSDRFLTYGGAVYNKGGAYLRAMTPSSSRRTGPYLFNPSRGDGMKVGGTTGSHVQRVAPYPETLGGRMWENRDIYINIPGAPPLPQSFVNGATSYSRENGKDVVYVSGVAGGTALSLYKHTIHELADPTKDTWEQIGRYRDPIAGQGSGAHDSFGNIFVRTASTRFTYWDLSTESPLNDNVVFTPEVVSGTFTLDNYFGMDFDPVRRTFVLWRGDGRVWRLRPPVPVAKEGWTIEQQPTATSPTPNGDVGTGILGKWKYIPNLDVFMGLQDSAAGNVWLYKPLGWQRPAPPPIVFLTEPQASSLFLSGSDVTLQAEATDPDGSVARVDFYGGAVKLGTDTTSPYSFLWTNIPVGEFTLTAVAVDDAGGAATSPAVDVSVWSGNYPPQVALTSPLEGQIFTVGSDIPLSATASDVDGTVARVEFYQGAVKLGEDSTSPYALVWRDVPEGSYAVSAVAIDDDGEPTASPATNIFVSVDSRATVELRDGLGGYAGTRDTYLDGWLTNTNSGSSASLRDMTPMLSSLVRFAKFHSEGGPIPDGAFIHSATLHLYKTTTYAQTYRVHRVLRDWKENEATWNLSRKGQPWAAPGAGDMGTDILATADAQTVIGWDPQWMQLDVTSGVRDAALGQIHFGWKLVAVPGDGNIKSFASREASNASLRPKLVIVYSTGNLYPNASLTSPSPGMVFTPGSDITLEAEASDPDGSVVRVEFHQGMVKLGEDSTSPYSFLWTNVPAESYLLTATAFDDEGASTVSSTVGISVSAANSPPQVTLTKPTSGQSFTPGSNITLEAQASDSDGSVVRVEFYRGTVKMGEDATSPYSFLWTNVPAGSYSLTARAIDNLGATNVSPIVSISVSAANSPPQVTLTQPTSGQSFAPGSNLALDAQASDSDGSVVRVEFHQGAVKLGEDTTSPYSFLWTNVPAGGYSLTALAIDDDGATTTSLLVNITISAGSGVSVVLQDGSVGYLGTRDTRLDGWLPTSSFGSHTSLSDMTAKLNSLVRFAIFQSAGGPVPDGSFIESATLHLYKSSYYDHLYRVHRVLRDWAENEATWSQFRAGQSWAGSGATGLGSDFLATPDAEAAAGWSPQWVQFDVTNAVRDIASGAANYGWRLVPVQGNNNIKTFSSSEASDITLRPKLVVVHR